MDGTPKSRIVPLGTGQIPASMALHDYNYFVYDCLLPKEMKRVLLYYATRFNWKSHSGTWVSLSRAANDLGVGRKYIALALWQLRDLGWLEVEALETHSTYFVTILIGEEVKNLKWREPRAKLKQLEDEYIAKRKHQKRGVGES